MCQIIGTTKTTDYEDQDFIYGIYGCCCIFGDSTGEKG